MPHEDNDASKLEKAEEVVSVILLSDHKPSGALRNQPAAYLRGRIEDFASAGGSVLVFSQARGEDFEALPGDIQGYGWQEDRSCTSWNIWFEEDVGDHPVLSSLLRNPFSTHVDGHFTTLPVGAQALFKKVVNNRVAGFMYPVGAGNLAVTSSFDDFQRAIRYARQSVQALSGGELSAAESVIRDWVTWLQDPVGLPRVDPSTFAVDLQVQIENDAPGHEHASLAKLLVSDPSRQGIERVEEVPVDLTFGQVAGVPMTIQLGPPHFNFDKYGIWHVEVELYDAEGNPIRPARDELSGRFVYPAPVGGYSFQPEQILITVTTTAQEIPSDAVAHYDSLLENQSDETRDLRVDVIERHRNYPPQQFLVTLGPGETWSHSLDLPRPQRESSVHIDYQVFDQHTGHPVASGGKRVYFLNFPVALDLVEDGAEVLPGSIQGLTVRYENLVATPMSGTLSLTLEGGQLLSVPVDIGPNSGGSIETWVQIPSDTPIGSDLSVQGSYTDAGSVVRGRFYGQILVRSDISDVLFWADLVERNYMRGDEATFDLVFENRSEQDRQVDCVLDWSVVTIWSDTIAMPPRSEKRQPVQFTIPIDHPASGTEIRTLTCTDSEGFSYSQ